MYILIIRERSFLRTTDIAIYGNLSIVDCSKIIEDHSDKAEAKDNSVYEYSIIIDDR